MVKKNGAIYQVYNTFLTGFPFFCTKPVKDIGKNVDRGKYNASIALPTGRTSLIFKKGILITADTIRGKNI